MTISKYICIACVVLLCTACTIAGNSDTHPDIDCSGTWKYSTSDNPELALPSLDDRDYPELVLPGSFTHLIIDQQNLEATIWLRKKIFIGEEYRGKTLCLLLGRIGVADETFLNGIQVGANGTIPKKEDDRYHFSWQQGRSYLLPATLVRYGDYNTIAIRVFSHVISGINGYMGITEYPGGYFAHRIENKTPILINISSVALNFLFLLGLGVLAVSRTGRREYLYFFLLVLFTLAGNVTMLDFNCAISGLLRYKMFLMSLTLVNFIALHAVMEFFDIKNKYIIWMSFLLGMPLVLAIVLAPDMSFLIKGAGLGTVIFVNLCILTAAVLFFMCIRRDPRRYWYFLFVAIPVPVSVLRNTFYMATFRFDELPMLIFFHVPLVFTIFALYYIYDFERMKREKDSLYGALLKKTKKMERILNSIKGESVKPDPRDMIHDVIEYLDVNYQERYDRKELSKKFGLNEDYMGQVFKKTTGINISNYINNKRIEGAKDLLMETDAKIIDIAYHVGFDNLTHFHRQFKKQTGKTPSEYRVMMQEKEGES